MSAPTYLIDAVLQWLRGSQVATVLGDTWDAGMATGTQKIGAEFLIQPALPYLLIGEPGETRTYFTAGQGQSLRPYLADGTLAMTVVAATRLQADQVGDLVAEVLHDAPLAWINGNSMMFRLTSSSFVSTPDPGPGSPAMFARALTFTFEYQGGI